MIQFESSVNSYDSQTEAISILKQILFESSVNSYDSQTRILNTLWILQFESSVNSYDSQTIRICPASFMCLRVV